MDMGGGEKQLSPQTMEKPVIAYGITKLAAGQLSRLMCEQKGIRHIWGRFFSVYGEYNGKDAMVISAILNFIKGEKMSCTEGNQVRDYLYSEDAARALYLLAQKGISGKTYCIGYGDGQRIRTIIECIRNLINPRISIGFGEVPYGNEPMRLVADITELTHDTGFVPQYTFEEGIAKTIQWVRQKIEKGETLQ